MTGRVEDMRKEKEEKEKSRRIWKIKVWTRNVEN